MLTFNRFHWVLALSLLAGATSAHPFQDTPARVKSEDWQDDPVCRMVFFAVLEGLYTDGVPTEIAELIAPRKEVGKDEVQHSFVIECPMCHPVFEAFRLYRDRKPFASGEGRNTFGTWKGDPKIVENLKSDQVFTRISAMGALVEPWIRKRLESMRLTEEETATWNKALLDRARKGGERFSALRATPGTVYNKLWGFYGGCQACEAVERAVKK